MTTTMHPIAEDYWTRLQRASLALPEQDRAELLAELRSHLETGLASTPTDADVRNFLDDLGRPEDIVAAADTQWRSSDTGSGSPAIRPATENTWGALEIAAVVALTAGAFLLPVVGPIIGLVLAWASPKWTKREKRVATRVVVAPVVLVMLGLLALVVARLAS